MIKIFKNFLDFCGEEQRKKLYKSFVLTIIDSLFGMLKIASIYVFLMDAVNNNLSGSTAVKCLVIMLISIVGSGLVKYVSTILQTEGGYETCANKRMQIAEHLRYVPMGYFSENSLGETLAVTTNVMEQLENIATRVVMLVGSAITTSVIITIMVLFFDFRIGLILLIGVILFAISSSILMKKSEELSPEKVKADTAVVSELMEYIEGINEVKTYKITGSKSKSLNDANDHCADINFRMEKRYIPYISVSEMIIKITGIIMALACAYFYLNGTMDLAKCLTLIISSFIVYASLEGANAYSALLRVVDICVNKGNNILKSEQMNLEGDTKDPVNLDIEAKNISFSYNKKEVIKDVSFKIPEKTTTAIVGPSGSGKSTITKLIARFFDVDSGVITLGGKDIKEYDYDTLMKNFSFVFQNVYLFKDTIANNIRFGVPNASMEEVVEASKKARCHEFIMKLPKGYDTVLGEDGVNLSGGEAQRLSIARAMMKDASIIVLDEATANVDPENEKELMEAISFLTKDKTIIMIAHRLKTVMNADQILVVENGKISERGTHEELIKTNSVYREFIMGRKKAVSWKIN